MNGSWSSRFSPLIFYLLGFLLLFEWLRPLEEIVNIENMYVFLLFVAVALLLYGLSIRFIWISVVLFVLIFGFLHYVYYPTISIYSFQWVSKLFDDISTSIGMLFKQDWINLKNSFRSILFFILLWILSYLVHYWIHVRKNIFLFYIMSVIFISILDTFTTYNGDWAIVRLFVIGFILIGSLSFKRLIQQEQLSISGKQYRRWIVPLIFFIVISGVIGFLLPKPIAQWADPVPFIISYSEKFTNEPTGAKVGYGEDDSYLGGGFEEDDTVVFTAATQSKHYWRVESKSLYTGLGWEHGGGSLPNEVINNGSHIPTDYYDIVEESNLNLKDKVEVEIPYSHIPYPTPSSSMTIIAPNKMNEVYFIYNPSTSKIESKSNDYSLSELDTFHVKYDVPTFNIDTLKGIQEPGEDFYSPEHLQLPPYLPERVRELAESITKDKDNRYDKVKAIENYLDRAEFVYNRKNIPYPKEDEDFVDQFLFETKTGYCDHFSTSMAIMLRSIGIPTRWVKGYTEGVFVKKENKESIYNVTNNNAHSWVEVLFPGVGWVPFEPTKGFTNNVRFESDFVNPSTGTDIGNQQDQPKEKAETPKSPRQMEEEASSGQISPKLVSIKDQLAKQWKKIVGGIALFVLLVLGLYVSRGKWIPYIWIWYFRSTSTNQPFAKAYTILLKQLKRYGLKRQEGQTLREYALYVDEFYSINEMSRLTHYYEEVIYGQGHSNESWKQGKPLWEKVMEKTIT